MGALSGEIGFRTLTRILGDRERQWSAKGKGNARTATAEDGRRLRKAQRSEPAMVGTLCKARNPCQSCRKAHRILWLSKQRGTHWEKLFGCPLNVRSGSKRPLQNWLFDSDGGGVIGP